METDGGTNFSFAAHSSYSSVAGLSGLSGYVRRRPELELLIEGHRDVLAALEDESYLKAKAVLASLEQLEEQVMEALARERERILEALNG